MAIYQSRALADVAVEKLRVFAQPQRLMILSYLLGGERQVADIEAATDAAFAKVPKAKLDALLADKAALTKVLTYHVVPAKVMAADVKAGKVKTVEGQELTVTTKGGVMVDNAKVVATDVAASNGVLHAIDTVLMPK